MRCPGCKTTRVRGAAAICANCRRAAGERSVSGGYGGGDWASPKGWLAAYGYPKPLFRPKRDA